MNFDAQHYVPVLKAKRGEKGALSLLDDKVAERVTPLLEIVERTENPLDDHLKTAFTKLAAAVSRFDRCFLDARELAPDGPVAAQAVFDRAAAEGIVFTPVTGITRSFDTRSALSHSSNGIALRITREEFEAGDLSSGILAFMRTHGLHPEHTDLIIDLGAVDNLIAAGVESLATAFLAEVPNHGSWRTFTLSACAFPKSMGSVDRHSHDHVDRAEWQTWRDGLHANRNDLERLPAFSDCAIQHPSGVEGFNPLFMPISASVRYTLDDTWLRIKGESTRNTSATSQFPNLAKMLAYGQLSSAYYGADHCSGCKSIKAAADGARKLGSPEVWRRIGTIHHIAKVVGDLGKLPWT
jgi:hypothetical protein